VANEKKEPKLEETAFSTADAIKPTEEMPPVKETNVFVKYLGLCMELSKARLGLLVAITTGAFVILFPFVIDSFIFSASFFFGVSFIAVGYLLGPGPVILSQLALTSLGTSLAIASANTLNQYREVEFDEMMSRTANRVLPSGMDC
jgi:hypothetical protein